MTEMKNTLAILQRNVLVALKLKQEHVNQGTMSQYSYDNLLSVPSLTNMVNNELATAELKGVLEDIATGQGISYAEVQALGGEVLNSLVQEAVANLQVLGRYEAQ